MTLLMGLMLVALGAGPQTTDPTGAYTLNPPTVDVEDVEVEGEALEGVRAQEVARRTNPDEVVCRERPVTGSRFTQRRCRTRYQAGVAQSEAQRMLGEMTRSSGSTDAALTGGPATGPQ